MDRKSQEEQSAVFPLEPEKSSQSSSGNFLTSSALNVISVSAQSVTQNRMVVPTLGRLLVVLQSGEPVALIAPGAAELLRTGLAVDFACALSARQSLDR